MENEMLSIRPSRLAAALVFATVIPTGLAYTVQWGDAHAADPTYAEDVAPILFRNCAGCHHPGGMGPFSVLNYDTTVAYKDDILDAVGGGVMPPWHATGAHGVFRNDRRLSEPDKQTIVRWIETGAKRGDMKRLPPVPVFTSRWMLGEPDAVVSMTEDFPVPASGTVEYQYFQVKTDFTEDIWVQSIEIKPGETEVVHHVLVYAYVPPAPNAAPPLQSGAAVTPPPATQPPLFIRSKNEQFDDPPRLDTLHAPPQRLGSLVATYVPGTRAIEFPEGTA